MQQAPPDFIAPQQGAQQPQQAVSQSPPVDFLNPQDQANLAQEAVTSGTPQPQSAGPVGAGLGAIEEDPLKAPDEDASTEEQEQYQDLFIRTMAAVNDTRSVGGGRSMADAVIRMLSTKDKEAHVAIGTTAGLVMTQMIDNAKRQGVEYPGPVIQEVGMDLIVELIELAGVSGAIKNMPQDEESEEFQALAKMAALEAAKYFGEWQIETGQADQVGHQKEVQDELQREADAGELDDWGMEEMDPAMRSQVAQRVGDVTRGP